MTRRSGALVPWLLSAAVLVLSSTGSALALPAARYTLMLAAALAVVAVTHEAAGGRGWLAAVLAASVAEALLLVSARPQLVQPGLALASIVVAAAAVLLWGEDGARRLVGWAAPLSAGLAMSAAFPTRGTVLAPLLWAAIPASAGMVVSLALSFDVSRAAPEGPGAPAVEVRRMAFASGLALLALAGLGREYGRLHLEGVDFVFTSAGRMLAYAAAAPVAVTLASAVLVALMRTLPGRVHLATVPVAVFLALALAPAVEVSSLVLDAPVTFARSRVENALDMDRQIAYGQLLAPGAGPRAEYRGFTFEECDRLNNRDCFITVYDDIALRYGVAAAIDDVLDKVKSNRGYTFPSHCHQVVHNLGQVAFQLARDFEAAAALDPQVCGTGYTHGLWEQQFVRLGSDAWFTRTGTLCRELNMQTPWYKWTCSHILGHLMSTALMDNPAVAVEYCNAMDDTEALVDCHAGAWMNFFQDDSVIAWFRSFGTLEQLFEICYGAAESVKFICYQELFPVVYPMVRGSDFLAAEACLKYAEPSRREGDPWQWGVSYVDRCLQGMARAVGVATAFSAEQIVERCRSMPVEAQDTCLSATAASLVLNTGSIAFSAPICLEVSDQGYRDYCFFWSKHSRQILANGPNAHNLPELDEIRRPEGVFVPEGVGERPFMFRQS